MSKPTQASSKGYLALALVFITIYFIIFGYGRADNLETEQAKAIFNIIGIAIFALGIFILMRAWKTSPFYHDKVMITRFNMIAIIIFLHMAPLRAQGIQTALSHLLEMFLFTPEVLHNVMLVFGVIVTLLLGLITFQIAPRDKKPKDVLDWFLVIITGVLLGWFLIALFAANPYQSLGLSMGLLFFYYSFLSRRHQKNIYADE